MKRAYFCTRAVLPILVASVSLPVVAFCQEANVAGQADNVAALQAGYIAARVRHDRALATLVAARREFVQQFQNAPQYTQAQLAAQEAHDQYQAAGSAAVAALKDHDPAYQQLLARQQQIDGELGQARQSRATTIETFNDLYNQKGAVSRQLEEMEQMAIAASSGQDLRRQWEDASGRLQALKQHVQTDVESAAAVVQAKNALNQAAQQMQQVGAQLAAADAAYQQSLYQQDLYAGTLGYSAGNSIDTDTIGYGWDNTAYANGRNHHEPEHHADHDRRGESEHHDAARPTPSPSPRSDDAPKGHRWIAVRDCASVLQGPGEVNHRAHRGHGEHRGQIEEIDPPISQICTDYKNQICVNLCQSVDRNPLRNFSVFAV